MGDVRYSQTSGDWVRSHDYQAATFAAGYRSVDAFVVACRSPTVNDVPRGVQAGDVHVHYVAWPTHELLSPEAAAASLVTDCGRWLYRTDTINTDG